ncbi:MAG: hypothetical protein EKK55_16445 [Rhodocyclaceae bacterium]|nr:MAG: hypothetical protein EKK55_16445 [Rhodocyclaceae bacterium]
MTALLALILGACRGPLLDLHAESPGRVLAAAPVCAEVAVKAAAAGHSAAWLTRLAYRESRLRRDLCSTAGACGPLQAVPEYWCKGEPCDLVAAGLRAWAHYERKAGGDRARALCRYTGRRGCV